MSPKQQSVAQPVDIMQGDINLNSKTDDGSCYIDLTYSQFKKYQQLIKDDKNKLKEEVYKDQSKFDVRRVLFGDDEIRKTLVRDRHDGIEYLERKFGTGYSEEDRVRPPTATYTFLVREKSPATLRREKTKLREWNKQQAIARKEQRLAEIKRLVRENSYSQQRRYFGGSEEAGHAADASDDRDDLYDSSRNSKQSFLSHVTPRTTCSDNLPIYGRRKKHRRKPRQLPPIDLNLRRLTIRIPSIFDRPSVIEELNTTELAEKHHQLPPLFATELTSASSLTFQYPQKGRKNVSRINDEWVAMRERRRNTPYPDDDTRTHHPTTVDKWRLLSTANIQDPPPINVFVSYPPDGKVVIKRRKLKKK